MDPTQSFVEELPQNILKRYDILEVRNATRILSALNASEFQNILEVLGSFTLERDDVLGEGKNKSKIARRLDEAFRERAWWEVRHDIAIHSTKAVQRYLSVRKPSVELGPFILNPGYKVDNFKGRVALDVEWHAKDGNLDRDLAEYRALYDVGIIDVGVIITRSQTSLRSLALSMKPTTDKFKTTTTTSIEKLAPRLTRGDAGGCPVVAFAITSKCSPLIWNEHEVEAKARALLTSRSLGICRCSDGICGMHSVLPPVHEAQGDSAWQPSICEAALRVAGTARTAEAVRKWARRVAAASAPLKSAGTKPVPPYEVNQKRALELMRFVGQWLPDDIQRLLAAHERRAQRRGR